MDAETVDDDLYCSECGRILTHPQHIERGIHYSCEKRGIAVAWRGGGGYTKEEFHNYTNAQVRRETESAAARAGRPVEPRPVRKELI